jgi:hypothetical protein
MAIQQISYGVNPQQLASNDWGTLWIDLEDGAGWRELHLRSWEEYSQLSITKPFNIQNIQGIKFYATNIRQYHFGKKFDINISPRFLSYAKLHDKIIIPEGITIINWGFLKFTQCFNLNIKFPSTLSQIHSDFLGGSDYDGEINLPTYEYTLYGGVCKAVSRLKKIYANCPFGKNTDDNSLTSSSLSDPSYINGIQITGPYASQWKAILPDKTGDYPRKLILV